MVALILTAVVSVGRVTLVRRYFVFRVMVTAPLIKERLCVVLSRAGGGYDR